MELDFFENTLLVDGALPIFTIFLRLPVQKDTLIKTLNNVNRTEWSLVCYKAVFSVVTQRALRDDTKNGSVAD